MARSSSGTGPLLLTYRALLPHQRPFKRLRVKVEPSCVRRAELRIHSKALVGDKCIVLALLPGEVEAVRQTQEMSRMLQRQPRQALNTL